MLKATESGIYNQITNPIHNVDPARTYNVSSVISDGSNLNASGVDDSILTVSAPSDSLTVTSVKTGVRVIKLTQLMLLLTQLI